MTYTVYRHLAIEKAKPAPSESQLRAIETELGAALPPSFKEYLKAANGGYLEYVVDVPMGDGRLEEMCFCGLFFAGEEDAGGETFIGEIREGREYAGIPEGVLPFARDGGGSTVYLDLSPEGKGRVVVFVMGKPAWAGLRTDSAWLELAASFDEYVDKLRIDVEAVLDHLEHDASALSHIAATEEWLDIGLPGWRNDPAIAEAVEAARARIADERNEE